MPDQEFPLQLLPDQEFPLQLLPDQEFPFQTPPDHELPAASSKAIWAASNDAPKMSCSPESVTPFCLRWTSPRESSSGPVPVEST